MAKQARPKHVTGKVRFAYPSLFVPSAPKRPDGSDMSEPKYNTAILIPKKSKKEIAKIEAAIKEAFESGKDSVFGGKLPKKWDSPLYDGDEDKPDNEAYEGQMFLNAKSKFKCAVLDEDGEEILAADEFPSGCYGRAIIHFFPYQTGKENGVGVGLNAVQKLEDGDEIGGGGGASQARKDFGIDESDDDDDDLS